MARGSRTTWLALAVAAWAGCASPAPERSAPPATDEGTAAVASQVRFVHGSPAHGYPGPWALAGYRLGADALRRLHTTREAAWDLLVTHRSPREVRYTCMLDGLLASTGASPGKMNLVLEAIPGAADLETVIVHRPTGRTLTYRLTPAFRARFFDTDYAAFPEAAHALAALRDEDVFTVVEAP